MAKMIFVNLPVGDLTRATAFYEAVGAIKDERFCDETASCMVFSETIHVMLLTHDKFRQFTPKRIANARETTEVLICISAESREAVDELADTALEVGGSAANPPIEMGDFMYGRSFQDLDGHIWEVIWMDPKTLEQSSLETAGAA